MNPTNAERINLPMRESVRAENCDRVINFRVRWQTAVETLSGRALQKIRLEFTPLSERLTSTHRSNGNDRSVNIVRPSHLPVSA
jgi:hypothetical protein